MERETCDKCGGFGVSDVLIRKGPLPQPAKMIRCDTCDGEGTVLVMPPFPTQETTPAEEIVRRIKEECERVVEGTELGPAEWYSPGVGKLAMARTILGIIREGRE